MWNRIEPLYKSSAALEPLLLLYRSLLLDRVTDINSGMQSWERGSHSREDDLHILPLSFRDICRPQKNTESSTSGSGLCGKPFQLFILLFLLPLMCSSLPSPLLVPHNPVCHSQHLMKQAMKTYAFLNKLAFKVSSYTCLLLCILVKVLSCLGTSSRGIESMGKLVSLLLVPQFRAYFRKIVLGPGDSVLSHSVGIATSSFRETENGFLVRMDS